MTSGTSVPSSEPESPRVEETSWYRREGALDPPGAHWLPEEGAWNFVLYSILAEGVTLLLYGNGDYESPAYEVDLDPIRNKSGPIWHCRVSEDELPVETSHYAYRVRGPEHGPYSRIGFDSRKILLDPYARAVFFPPGSSRDAACEPGPDDGKAPLGILEEKAPYDWEGDRSPNHGADLVIYEMHVRGFTQHESSGVDDAHRGTFTGVVEKIPHLVELGVTAVELMPVFQYDPDEGNYWGYMPLSFFAPHAGYASHPESFRQRREFRDMVKALHSAGIEVYLDVVYNHTCEGDERGPTYSYKGIDPEMYYILFPGARHPYGNYSGTGNTLDAGAPGVRKLIVDSLRFWRQEMHVDGFRFDLASTFARRSDGSIDHVDPPIFGQIIAGLGAVTRRESISRLRLIAEPWDAGGAYHLGRSFPGWLWMQWNGRFRDSLQQFVRGDFGRVTELMTRVYGSSDLFPDDLKNACRPWQSVNYVTSHDGSTLYDLVSYDEKRNWANGHGNTDGHDEHTWSCGWEGDEAVPPEVMLLRRRQVKNFLALLFLSNGTPMIRMGDEFLQTQGGNNNPYNQDNETSWLDWRRLEEHRDVFEFTKGMIAFRRAHPSIGRSHFWREDVRWYGTEGPPDLTPGSRTLAWFLAGGDVHDRDLYAMVNAHDGPLEFRVQEPGPWRRVIDTSRESPDDFLDPEGGILLTGESYRVEGRSVVVLVR